MTPARDPKQVFRNQLAEGIYDIYFDASWIQLDPLNTFGVTSTHVGYVFIVYT